MRYLDQLKARLKDARARGDKSAEAVIIEALGPHAPKEKEKLKPKEGG